MEEQRVLNIKIPAKLYDELKAAAKSKNISLAAFVRMALTEYLLQIRRVVDEASVSTKK